MKFPQYLTAVLAVVVSANAATPTVIYQTGWEAAPAVPGWVAGNIMPQNGWGQFNNAAGNQVVVNGTAAASIGGQAIATPTGSQFHKFTASSSPSTIFDRFAFPDVASTLSTLPATHKLFKVSIDVFVPSTQEGVNALHGVFGVHRFDPTTGDVNFPWGMLIDPGDLSINILWDNQITLSSFVPDTVDLDTWFNVQLTVNYNSGAISVSKNGTVLSQISQTSMDISTDTLTNVFFVTENYDPGAPAIRSIATDNFLFTVEEDISARPTLTITPIPPDNLAYKLRWPAANAGWVLEYTDEFVTGGSTWTPQGTAPTADADPAFVYVEVAVETLHRYFRLRKP
jgi:hypothetical protein